MHAIRLYRLRKVTCPMLIQCVKMMQLTYLEVLCKMLAPSNRVELVECCLWLVLLMYSTCLMGDAVDPCSHLCVAMINS